MAMSSPAFRVCPVCGSRSKLKWDFCARCGESLHGILGERGLHDRVEAGISKRWYGFFDHGCHR